MGLLTVTRGSRTRSLEWTVFRMPQSMMEVESEPQQKSQERVKKKHRKWTFGGLFRRKKAKDSTSESSDSDDASNQKKGGFLARRQRRRAANRGSKDVTGSFEHVVMRPSGGSSGNLSEGKRSLKARVEANRDRLRNESSSEEDSPRLPRSHRNSKRLSKDMTDCSAIKVLDLDSSPRSPRWTAKIVYCESSDYEARYTARTRSATPSPAQSPVTKRAATAKQQLANNSRPPKPAPVAPRPFIDQKSASFDLLPRPSRNNPRVPPPPPPRDPQRKIIPPLGYTTSFDRPLSYAFESDQPLPKLMMDHNSNITPYKVHSSSSLENRRPYHYYTDQQPRSRRPIHIARTDQQHSYLSDSQIGRTRSHYGSADWRIPRGSNSSLYDSSDSREGPETRQLSMVLETQEQVQNRLPQSFNHLKPMKNDYSFKNQQQNSMQNGEVNRIHNQKYQVNTQPIQAHPHQQYWDNQQQYNDNHQQYRENHHQYKDNHPQYKENNHQYQDNHQQTQKINVSKPNSVNTHRKSNNLEDALDELEAIYKSLQINDEDPPNPRGFESDTGCYRYIDDMAYRRLNRRDSNGSPDCRVIASQAGSYLLVSPALSPPPFANAPPIIPTPDNEPDITLDDVVYRSLRHANNTLKISDPQPPFGIPLGPVAPAANSDYLHASPKEGYRSSFKPRKTPDIVKDDLAYRNLRKDKNCDSLLNPEECVTNETTTIKKKRAARSLSANLLSIIQKENSISEDKRNSYNEQSNMEKTRSFSDLPDILNCRYKVNRFFGDDSDVTPRASRQFQELPLSTTSTETLTDSKTEVVTSNDYCSGRGRPVSLQNNKPLPKTEYTKNRLPSPSHRTSSPVRNRSSSSTSPHRIPSPQRVSSLSPHRTSYSTEGRIKYSSPTSVNLEKYMQRYNDNSVYQNNSSTKIKQNGVEQMSFDVVSGGNHGELTSNLNRDESVVVCQKRPSPVSSPHHEYYRKHLTKQHVITGETTTPSVISVNTNKYLRDTQQTRSDTLVNNQAHSNSEKVHSSPLIYVRIPEKNQPTNNMRDNPGPSGTPLSPTKSNVHNIVGSFNRLISDNSPLNSHLKTVEDNLTHSNSNKLRSLAQPLERSTENRSYTQVYHSSPKNSESTKDNYHSLLLKQFENNTDKNKSKNGVCNSSGEVLEDKRDQSNTVNHSSSSKTIDSITTPKKEIGSNDKLKTQSQIDGQITKSIFSSPTARNSSMISKQEVNPGSSFKNQSDLKNQDSSNSRSSPFVPTSPHVSLSTGNVTNLRAQEPEICTAGPFRVNSKKPFDNDFKNSKSLPEISNSNKITNHKIYSTENIACRIADDNTRVNHKILDKAQNSVNNHLLKSGNNSLHVNNLEVESEVSPDENEQGVLSGNIAIKVLCSNPKYENQSFQNSRNTDIQTSIQQTQTKPNSHKSENKNTLNTHAIPASMKLPCHSYSSESIKIPLPMQANRSKKDCKVDSKEKSNENLSNKYENGQAEVESLTFEVECQQRTSAQTNDSNSKELLSRSSQSLLEHQQSSKQSLITREEAKEDEILNKDLNKLLSEINSKQEKLLNEASSTSGRRQELASATDKKDSVAIGKIIQHKPVKLNTYLIDEEHINKNETKVDDVVRSSESMTDLLQELTRSLDQDFGVEKQIQENNSSDGALSDYEIASSVSQDILQSVAAETISVVSDLSDSRDCSEICEILQDAAGKLGEGSFGRCEPHNEQNNDETSQASNNTEMDRVDCPSDTDSNAEFVEQICKTASELSDLSSSTSNPIAICNQFPVAAERMRPSRAPAQADHSEGIVSSCSSRSSMLKPLVNSSGLLMLTTHCMADLHQMVDVDFLTMLGLLIAILSLFWLLIS